MTEPNVQLNRFLRETRRPPHDTPTGDLYHYTSAEGFKGIVTGQRVWATHFQYLNDAEELQGGYDIIQGVAEDLAREGGALDGTFERLAQDLAEHNLVRLGDAIFIASFSEPGNDLSQWRAYAANGRGYSIGVRPRFADLDDLTAPYHVGLLRCCYDDREFRERVRSEFTSIGEALLRRGVQGQAWVELEQEARRVMMVQAAMLAARRKHHAFESEREWRVIALTHRDELVKYRETSFGLTPYLEIPLTTEDEPLPITHAFVGPTQDPSLGVRSAKMLLAQHAYPDVPVDESGIPYRV